MEEGRKKSRLALIYLVKEQVEKDGPVPKEEEIFDPPHPPPPPEPSSSIFQELKRIMLLSKLVYIHTPSLQGDKALALCGQWLSYVGVTVL